MRLIADGKQRRIRCIRLGITDHFGIERQGFVIAQRDLATVGHCQINLRAGRRDQDFAFEDGVANLQLAHLSVFALGECRALNGGNVCDGGIGGHAGTSRRKN